MHTRALEGQGVSVGCLVSVIKCLTDTTSRGKTLAMVSEGSACGCLAVREGTEHCSSTVEAI